MRKKTNELVIAGSIMAALVLLGYGGWKIYQVYLFAGDAWHMMGETDDFWKEYESKTQEFYEEFADGCDELFTVYASYVDYPFDVPLDNNPSLPPSMLGTDPKAITFLSRRHMSVTVVSFRDNTDVGFHITCKGEPDGTLNVFLGGDQYEGHIVHTRQGM